MLWFGERCDESASTCHPTPQAAQEQPSPPAEGFPWGSQSAVRSQTAVWEEGRRGRVHVLGGLTQSLGLAEWVAEKVSFLLVGSYPLKPCTFLP